MASLVVVISVIRIKLETVFAQTSMAGLAALHCTALCHIISRDGELNRVHSCSHRVLRARQKTMCITSERKREATDTTAREKTHEMNE
jgi:hypothetical protein